MERMDVEVFGSVAKNKYEIYRVLVTEGNLYLPPLKKTSIYFIKDILQGKKSVSHTLQIIISLGFEWR